MTPATTKRSIDTTIIGSGTLATALAMALRRSGHRVVEIVARNNAQSISRARKLAKRVDARVGTLLEAQFNTKATWICVPDDAIFDVAGQIVTAIITRQSSDELRLRKGMPAFALIKATEVMIATGARTPRRAGR